MPDDQEIEELHHATTQAEAEVAGEPTPGDAEIARLREEAQRAYQDYLRAVADLDTFKRLAARQQQEAVARARREMLGVILSAADVLDRALRAGESATTDAVLEGIRLAHRQVLDLLAQHGVRPMETVGHAFDPRYHEAVGVGTPPPGAEDAFPPGTIVAEHQRGYLHHGEVLRPARVLVVREP